MRHIVVIGAIFLFAGGCNFAFYAKPCARSPEDATNKLFEAFTSTEDISVDIEKPPGIKEALNIKKIMRVAPDPRTLLRSMGKGDPKKGWDEFIFLKGLAVFYGTSRYEFQGYAAFIDSITALPAQDGRIEKYRLRIKRVDTLLDMRDDNDLKEIKKFYLRDFVGEFSRGNYCVIALTPINDWKETGGKL